MLGSQSIASAQWARLMRRAHALLVHGTERRIHATQNTLRRVPSCRSQSRTVCGRPIVRRDQADVGDSAYESFPAWRIGRCHEGAALSPPSSAKSVQETKRGKEWAK